MYKESSSKPDECIDLVLSYIQEHDSGNDVAQLLDFCRLYFSQVSAEDLSSRPLRLLADAVRSHWEALKQFNTSSISFSTSVMLASEYGCFPDTILIQIVVDDMPFLVDSIRLELERMGIAPRWLVYTGGLQRFTEQGQQLRIAPYGQDTASHLVSPIMIEIPCQQNADALSVIESNLRRVIGDVQLCVRDWPLMRQTMSDTIDQIKQCSVVSVSESQETMAYLEWLLDDHFTFLGVRDYQFVGEGDQAGMQLIPGSSLGVLADETSSKTMRYFTELPLRARRVMFSNKRYLVLSKTNTLSTVHRGGYTDYLAIKRFDSDGSLIGERRFIGLYTSEAYSTLPQHVPLLRKKVAQVLRKSGFPQLSHASNDLMHIMTTLSRDDLFQSSPKELLSISLGIMHLQDRRCIRLFARRDIYARFMSCYVFMSREVFTTSYIDKVQDILMSRFCGIESTYTIHFSSAVLVQVNYLIRIDASQPASYSLSSIEAEIIAAGQGWPSKLRTELQKHYPQRESQALYLKYGNGFSVSYQEHFSAQAALADIVNLEQLLSSGEMQVETICNQSTEGFDGTTGLIFKVYQQDRAMPLCDVLPILENMGMRTLSERPYIIRLNTGKRVWINEFYMVFNKGDVASSFIESQEAFNAAFCQAWHHRIENDRLNQLIVQSGFSWKEVNMLRAYSRYMKQLDVTFSQNYIADTLLANQQFTRTLTNYFLVKFSETEAKTGIATQRLPDLQTALESALDRISNLDADRILRTFFNLVKATVRTNYNLADADGGALSYLSIKLCPEQIDMIPSPKPQYEIYVYAVDFEGVHLRFDKVARGGLRWSDRKEDFRTEVLGLAKAQKVKNSVIVPAGAKGGFIQKTAPAEPGREGWMKHGVFCYQQFIKGLLDCVDNIQNGQIVKHAGVVAYDGEDPYLVVAADKGTATFSDIANAIAVERKFWLGDAFASGGSVGYDHKKMGITARGAWVSAVRHFQEADNVNIASSQITVVGIGDMSGDVFGNGLLSSDHIKLVAAFNHQHIFLDPNPDPLKSFAERQRLFEMPRSSWLDYNPKRISRGGGVYSREEKSIVLSKQVRALLGVEVASMNPNELIKAIMTAPVDMIWNGGIGTYVKSSLESHADASDRANDILRVNGNQLQARVLCEGGNLGLTQLGRIEYAQAGGRINTDFIDNSAGVDCSDHEVNIKILLNSAVDANRITLKKRNQLLLDMTDDVAEMVLSNNYSQSRLIGQCAMHSTTHIDLYTNFIAYYDKQGIMRRELENLPSEEDLVERKSAGLGLTRPEVSVIVAYSKNRLTDLLRSSSLIDDPFFSSLVLKAFPSQLHKSFSSEIKQHRLYREIISTQLSNMLVSEMGPTFLYQMQDEMDIDFESVIYAYVIARHIFQLDDIMSQLRQLDFGVDSVVQYKIMGDLTRLIRRSSRWLLRHESSLSDVERLISRYQKHLSVLIDKVPGLLVSRNKAYYDKQLTYYLGHGVDARLANKAVLSGVMYHMFNVIAVAEAKSCDVSVACDCYFAITQSLKLIWLRDLVNQYPIQNHWVALAKSAYKADLDHIQSNLTAQLIGADGATDTDAQVSLAAWNQEHELFLQRWQLIIKDLTSSKRADFAVIAIAIKELLNLTQ